MIKIWHYMIIRVENSENIMKSRHNKRRTSYQQRAAVTHAPAICVFWTASHNTAFFVFAMPLLKNLLIEFVLWCRISKMKVRTIFFRKLFHFFIAFMEILRRKIYFYQTLFFTNCSNTKFNLPIQQNKDNNTGKHMKKRTVSLLLLLFNRFSNFSPMETGKGEGKIRLSIVSHISSNAISIS